MKKNMKKIMALALAGTMALGMTTAALADTTPVNTSDGQTGTITVQKPVSNQSYVAYKIFDVEYKGGAYAYTIEGDSEWYTAVKAYADVVANGLTLTATADTTDNTYIVETTAAFSAPAFAAALDNAKTGKTGKPINEESNGALVADDLPLGYYFIDSTTGALCNLTTTDPSAIIYDKNDIPFEKTADDVSVEVGQIVNFDITAEVPNTTGFKSYTYEIADTMTAGLTFNDAMSVKVGGEALDSEHYTYTKVNNGFKVVIDAMEIQDKIGEQILLEYTATVNKAAVAVVDENNAILTYSNNPTTDTTDDKEDTVKTYSAKIVIDKYAENKKDEDDKSTKLANAEFVLYKMSGTDKQYYYYNETNDDVVWTTLTDAELKTVLASDNNTTVTVEITDANGAADFVGLEDGTYYLLETEAPTGYNLLKTPVEVTVAGADALTATTSEQITAALTDTAEVANSTGAELPETGGMGTTIFYILGSIMALGAGVLLFAKKRMGFED